MFLFTFVILFRTQPRLKALFDYFVCVYVIRTSQLCLQKMGMKSHSMIQTARISGGSSGTLNSIVSAADLSFSGADDEEKAKLLLGMVQPKQAKGHKSGLRADKKKK